MDDENFNIPCIEEDLENMPAEELDNYYQMLGSGGILELNWKCNGRRPPTPDEEDEVKVETPVKESPKNLEFDFLEESPQQQTMMRVRSQNSALKGSAKKKTTNFAGVIDQMKKHKRDFRSGASTTPTANSTP